jgi:hypothetical protein
MNSNWIHNNLAYETERGRKALEVAKKQEQDQKNKQLCQKK